MKKVLFVISDDTKRESFEEVERNICIAEGNEMVTMQHIFNTVNLNYKHGSGPTEDDYIEALRLFIQNEADEVHVSVNCDDYLYERMDSGFAEAYGKECLYTIF